MNHLEAVFDRSADAISRVYKSLEPAFDLAKINEAEFWRNVNSALHTNVEPRLLSSLVTTSCSLEPTVCAIVERYSPYCCIVAYSNYRKEWFDRLDRRLRLSDRFSRIFLSSETGYLKPDPAVPSYLARALNCAVEQLVLIDDEEANTDAFQSAGAKAIKYRDPYGLEAELHTIVNNRSIDYEERYSGVFLMTPTKALVLQRRDISPTIANPGLLSVFGGRANPRESMTEAAARELREETMLKIGNDDLEHVFEAGCKIEEGKWMRCSFFVVRNVSLTDIELQEGTNIEVWSAMEALALKDLTPVTRAALGTLLYDGII